MTELVGFVEVDGITAEQTAAERERLGWRVFRLPFRMSSRDEFFDGVRMTFPLDPDLKSDRSWDALADSLWAGLDDSPDERIVVIWPNARQMKVRAPEDFAIATSILSDLPRSLADVDATVGSPKRVLILQVL